jgi:hypothetical protein
MDEEIGLPETKKNLLVRMKISCEKRRYVCAILSSVIGGFLHGIFSILPTNG